MKTWDVMIGGVYATQIAAATQREALAKAKGYFGHYKGRKVTVKAVRGRKNPTKAQKREKAKKLSAKRRIAEALKKFVQKANPAAKGVVKATKVKGGWNVRVVKVNAGSGQWSVYAADKRGTQGTRGHVYMGAVSAASKASATSKAKRMFPHYSSYKVVKA